MSASALKSAVQDAIDGLRAQFGPERVTVASDDQGGAWVQVDDLELGATYVQEATFLICLLPFNLPNADVYPAFVRDDLQRVDGQSLGEGFQTTQMQWPGEPSTRPVVQISRRTRNSQFSDQTPAQKIEKVLSWLRSR
jgi:hypothetical protein